MLKKAIELAKGTEEPKVGLSVQVPKNLKDEFEKICKTNDVSMSSMLLSLIQVAVNENHEKEEKLNDIQSQIHQLEFKLEPLQKIHEDSGLDELKKEDGSVMYIKKDIDKLTKQIESLEQDISYILHEL